MNVISEFSNMVKTTIPGSYVSHTFSAYSLYASISLLKRRNDRTL